MGKSALKFVERNTTWFADWSTWLGGEVYVEMLGVKEYMFTAYKCQRNPGYDLSILAKLLATWWNWSTMKEKMFVHWKKKRNIKKTKKWTKLLLTRSSRDPWSPYHLLALKSSEYLPVPLSPVRWHILIINLLFFCIFCKFHSDTAMERNTLMAQCYPKLKDYCREKHGLEFQVNIKQLEEFT